MRVHHRVGLSFQEKSMMSRRLQVSILEEKIRLLIRVALTQQSSTKQNAEILVDAVYQKELAKGSWSNVSLEQGAEMLAQKARQEVSRIRGAANGGQALPSKPAMVASSSGGQVPAVPAPQQVSKTFVDELRTMRKRG
jgi:hypothetical protein